MPSATTNGARIRTNTPAENAYNALESSNRNIALRQLRLSTGKRINAAEDDVAGYITVRSINSRTGTLRSALNSVGDAKNVAAIIQDSLDNINNLLTQIKDAVAYATSGVMGTDEKIALAKSAFRLAEQIQTVVDSTVFGGKQLLGGTFSGDFVVGFNATNQLLTIGLDLTTGTSEFNIAGNDTSLLFNNGRFAGIDGLNLLSLNDVSATNLGIFDSSIVSLTLSSISDALTNVNKIAAYVGGVQNRLSSQEDVIKSQITNYSAAASRIEDADVALEQLSLAKSQFLQQAALTSLTQANQSPQSFLQLFR
ncbi:MAG: flagellin [Candidatus Kapabacteria bacterium]|nr:flagellin [Candidatus Kapabacteria bacterium]